MGKKILAIMLNGIKGVLFFVMMLFRPFIHLLFKLMACASVLAFVISALLSQLPLSSKLIFLVVGVVCYLAMWIYDTVLSMLSNETMVFDV